MSDAKHTLGPWEAESARVYKAGKGGSLIATCAWLPGQEVANARLIAAAPDLLAALKLIVQWDAEDLALCDHHIEQAKEAITAATGEQHV